MTVCLSFLEVAHLCAALCIGVTLQDIPHHDGVAFLNCPVEGSLSILV